MDALLHQVMPGSIHGIHIVFHQRTVRCSQYRRYQTVAYGHIRRFCIQVCHRGAIAAAYRQHRIAAAPGRVRSLPVRGPVFRDIGTAGKPQQRDGIVPRLLRFFHRHRVRPRKQRGQVPLFHLLRNLGRGQEMPCRCYAPGTQAAQGYRCGNQPPHRPPDSPHRRRLAMSAFNVLQRLTQDLLLLCPGQFMLRPLQVFHLIIHISHARTPFRISAQIVVLTVPAPGTVVH